MVIYWDASAILSILVQDNHSSTVERYIKKEGLHLLSTLADAEVRAVLQRMKHDNSLPPVLYNKVLKSYHQQPLRKININPDWHSISKLAVQYVLKGADLWHLATVKTIHMELPEVKMLTFDRQLFKAAKKEDFVL